MEAVVRVALEQIATRFSDDAPARTLEAILLKRYPDMLSWPLDAQLALMLMGWTLGAGFHVKGFREAVNSMTPDFARAATLVRFGTAPTLARLELITQRAWRNAAVVMRCNLDPDFLYHPSDLTRCAGAAL